MKFEAKIMKGYMHTLSPKQASWATGIYPFFLHREPSPTKDPLPMTDEMRRSLNEDSIHETNKQSARNESNGINNHSSKSRPGSPATDSENEG